MRNKSKRKVQPVIYEKLILCILFVPLSPDCFIGCFIWPLSLIQSVLFTNVIEVKLQALFYILKYSKRTFPSVQSRNSTQLSNIFEKRSCTYLIHVQEYSHYYAMNFYNFIYFKTLYYILKNKMSLKTSKNFNWWHRFNS